MCESSDEHEQSQTTLSTRPRYARLGAHQGAAIGVCIFLSASDLRELNIDPDSQETIEYQIREFGANRVVEISGADSTVGDTLTPSTTD